MVSLVEAFLGNAIVVGLVDDPDGSLRMLIAGTPDGLHTHVDDDEAKASLRREWANTMQHVFATVPKEALCTCSLGDDDA